MSVSYRQTIIVELQGQTEEALFTTRLKFEKGMADLGRELAKLKGAGGILAVIPDKVREWNPESVKARA
jgi:hypothetical protein